MYKHASQFSPYFSRLNYCAYLGVVITGIFSFLRLANSTRHSLEAVCARLETGCKPWSSCQTIAETFKKGSYKKDDVGGDVGTYHIRLLRVMKGELYIDWPWGANRFLRNAYSNGMCVLVYVRVSKTLLLPLL